jgi:hypothetical protein
VIDQLDAGDVLPAEYVRWFEALRAALHNTGRGEALQAIADLDLDDLLVIEPPPRIGTGLTTRLFFAPEPATRGY